MSAAGATLLTFTRKRVASTPSADGGAAAAKRLRVSDPGSAQGSPWARVRSGKPPASRRPGVGRPLFVAPQATGKERTALGQSRSHNSSGEVTDTAGQRRSGAPRLPASALQAKVEFFHAVDQEVRGRQLRAVCNAVSELVSTCRELRLVSCGRAYAPSHHRDARPPRDARYPRAAPAPVAPTNAAVAPTGLCAAGREKLQLRAANARLHTESHPGALPLAGAAC